MRGLDAALVFVSLSSCALFSPVLPASAAEGHLGVADLLDWERVSDPRISPDGSRVIHTRHWVNQLEDRWESELWIGRSDGTRNRFLTRGSGARWSPDGTRIAYLADGKPEGTQIFVRWMDAEGATTQITRVLEAPASVTWSPDGKRLACVMLVERQSSWNIDVPKAPRGAKWTEPPRIVETTHYRQDRHGFLRDGFRHLFVVDSGGGTPRQLTEGDWNVGARPYGMSFPATIGWISGGKEIIFDGLREPDADRRYRESHLYAVDVESRAVRQITREKGAWSSPAVSPSGGKIAYTGFRWTPQTYRARELHVIDVDGSNRRQVSGDLDRDPFDLHWAPDESGVYFTAHDRGSSNVHFAPLDGAVRRVTTGVHMLRLGTVAKGRIAVGIRSSPREPADVVRFDLADGSGLARLTRVNDDILAERKLGEVEEIWYDSSGGARIQGWIVKPPDFDPAKRYPLILHIHGGPHAMYNVGFSTSFQILAAAGYVVLYTNPRGSTGYGTQFGNAIENAYPSVDYDDLMAGVDQILLRGYLDPARLYVTGVSGGGVLSSWTIGHTDRFAAAAVRAPVINWISFAGTTDISAWGYYRFRKPFWDDPDLWLRHSPLMYVKNVKTPTLLMTGELDLRTPMGQTEEYYQALRALGVPTALIRFHDEYHGTSSKPSNSMRTLLYLMKWFEKHRRDAASG